MKCEHAGCDRKATHGLKAHAMLVFRRPDGSAYLKGITLSFDAGFCGVHALLVYAQPGEEFGRDEWKRWAERLSREYGADVLRRWMRFRVVSLAEAIAE